MEQSNDQRAGVEAAAEDTAGALLSAVEGARATLQAYMENAGGNTNYFRSTELLLRNYPELAELVVDTEMYMENARRERSKSLVSFRTNAGGLPPGEAEDEAERIRENNFAYTKDRFDEISRVIKVYAGRKEMAVVRMYYFREDKSGKRINANAEDITFEFVASELGIAEKTARTWRSRIVNDMAIALFGKGAAIEAATYRKQRQQGLTSAG